MKRVVVGLVLVVMLLTLTACKQEKEDLIFYVVKAADLPAEAAESTLLGIAEEHGRAAFTAENIESWYWETHRITLKEVAVRGGSGSSGSSLFQADADDTFVLALGNRVLLWGGFENKVGALAVDRTLYIADDAEGDSFHIQCRQAYEESEDPRRVDALYDFLADHHLLASEV